MDALDRMLCIRNTAHSLRYRLLKGNAVVASCAVYRAGRCVPLVGGRQRHRRVWFGEGKWAAISSPSVIGRGDSTGVHSFIARLHRIEPTRMFGVLHLR